MISPAEQIDCLSILGLSWDKNNRTHFASSQIRIIYHLYNFGKGNESIFPKTATIAKALKIHHATVDRFINSEEFRKFATKIRRAFTSNLYILHPWVIECFKALEKLGFMKYFRENFERWRKLWKVRMGKFYCSKLINISSWDQVFKYKLDRNKLSTKRIDGCGMEDGDRCCTTRSTSYYKEDMKNSAFWVPSNDVEKMEKLLERKIKHTLEDMKWYVLEQNRKIHNYAAFFADSLARNLKSEKIAV